MFKSKLKDYTDVGGKMDELEKCRTFLSCLQTDPAWDQFIASKITTEHIVGHDGLIYPNPLSLEMLFLYAKESSNIQTKLRPSKPSVTHESHFTMNNLPPDSNEKYSMIKKFNKLNPFIDCFNCGGKGHGAKNCSSGQRDPKVWKIKNQAEWEKTDSAVSKQKKSRKITFKKQESEEDSNCTWEVNQESFNTDFENNGDHFLIDNACTTTVIKEKDYFMNYQSCEPYSLGTIADYPNSKRGGAADVIGFGDICIESETNGKKHRWIIKNAKHVPDGRRNLISDPQLHRQGYSVSKEKDSESVLVWKGDTPVAQFKLNDNNFYALVKGKMVHPEESHFLESKTSVSASIWHDRLGHVSNDRTKKIKELPFKKVINCGDCLISKLKSLPHPIQNSKLKYKPGELIVGDYKLKKNGFLDGSDVGLFILVDFSTGFGALFAVDGKTGRNQMDCFIKFQKYLKTQYSLEIKRFRHDQGKEFLNDEFQKYLESQGIANQSTSSYSPESNGIAESRFRVLNEMSTAMMAKANLNTRFYSHAMLTANYLYNRIRTTSGDASLAILSEKTPSLNHLRVFGCKAYYYVPKELRKKADYPGRQFPGR